MADEVITVIGDLRRMAWNIPGNRAANMRRRAKLIENYLNKKKDERNTKTHCRTHRETE